MPDFDELRLQLVRRFRNRGSHCPEDLASETIARVWEKEISGELIANMGAFCTAVGRNVLREHWRSQTRDVKIAEGLHILGRTAADRQACECICLSNLLRLVLGRKDERLLTAYYGLQGGDSSAEARVALAKRLAINGNTLRLRAKRIRAKVLKHLRGCENHCIAAKYLLRNVTD